MIGKALGKIADTGKNLIMGTVTASGIPEAIVAAILVTVIGKALLKLKNQLNLK